MKQTVTKVFEIQWEVVESDLRATNNQSFDDLDEALQNAKERLLNSQSSWPMIQIRRNEVQINQRI